MGASCRYRPLPCPFVVPRFSDATPACALGVPDQSCRLGRHRPLPWAAALGALPCSRAHVTHRARPGPAAGKLCLAVDGVGRASRPAGPRRSAGRPSPRRCLARRGGRARPRAAPARPCAPRPAAGARSRARHAPSRAGGRGGAGTIVPRSGPARLSSRVRRRARLHPRPQDPANRRHGLGDPDGPGGRGLPPIPHIAQAAQLARQCIHWEHRAPPLRRVGRRRGRKC